ncbi:MAG: DNA helicase [Desulfobulbus propionicus]|nr:MAG: DNA helicase [Desulfobulbus propionicus]
MPDAISNFYTQHLPDSTFNGAMLVAECPFCKKKGVAGKITVLLNPEHYFHGYFRCPNSCSSGGFPIYFAKQLAIPLAQVPGADPDREYVGREIDYPPKNINQDVVDFHDKLTPELREEFQHHSISREILSQLQIGYNGRYLVFPYEQYDGNYYAARCVHPDKYEDSFWLGDQRFVENKTRIFNLPEIDRCENGSLLVVEGEKNLLALKSLGLPGIAVSSAAELEMIDPRVLEWVRTLFVWVDNTAESAKAARSFATMAGYKVRLVSWQDTHPRKYSAWKMAEESGRQFKQIAFEMIRSAKAFSPFVTPTSEYNLFASKLAMLSDPARQKIATGFPSFDKALGNLQGISIMGGTPKAGKSCFFIQIATELGRQKVPVIYYDFENGKQNIYLRTLSRWAQVRVDDLTAGNHTDEEKQRVSEAHKELQQSFRWLRVVNDRSLTPEIMRRHIDFLRHEANAEHVVVVIDSLHKLPFKDLTKRRSGIDGWLRQLEAIRDELGVAFLVISELNRGKDGQFERQPQLGSFKGSGDIAYSADNALVFLPEWEPFDATPPEQRINKLWMVASREHSPGLIAAYRLDFPYWGFVEQ